MNKNSSSLGIGHKKNIINEELRAHIKKLSKGKQLLPWILHHLHQIAGPNHRVLVL
jgi:hypothetical protein